jgi:hypothetical protein
MSHISKLGECSCVATRVKNCMKNKNGTITITMIMQNLLEIIYVILIMFTIRILHIIYD